MTLAASDMSTGTATITSVTAATSTTVEESTTYVIVFTLPSSLSTAAKLIINFPSLITFTAGACT